MRDTRTGVEIDAFVHLAAQFDCLRLERVRHRIVERGIGLEACGRHNASQEHKHSQNKSHTTSSERNVCPYCTK